MSEGKWGMGTQYSIYPSHVARIPVDFSFRKNFKLIDWFFDCSSPETLLKTNVIKPYIDCKL